MHLDLRLRMPFDGLLGGDGGRIKDHVKGENGGSHFSFSPSSSRLLPPPSFPSILKSKSSSRTDQQRSCRDSAGWTFANKTRVGEGSDKWCRDSDLQADDRWKQVKG